MHLMARVIKAFLMELLQHQIAKQTDVALPSLTGRDV